MAQYLDHETELVTSSGKPVILRRSVKRRRTVSAFWETGSAIIAIPGNLSHAEGLAWAKKLLPRLEAPTRRGQRTDAQLHAHAKELSRRFLVENPQPVSVRWVDNQHGRWGSTTPAHGTIRLSSALKGMPDWVINYVLLHELAHLIVSGHGPRFWAQLENYPQLEAARAFLAGVSYATSHGLNSADAPESDAD